MNRASTTVTFAVATSAAGALSAVVDEEATRASSPYSPGTKVFLRLYGRGSASVSAVSLGCAVSQTAAGQISRHTETVKVIKGDRLSLSHPAKRLVALQWLAVQGDPANAHINPDNAGELQLSSTVKLGIAEVTYEAEYDRYAADSLSGPAALILFEASDGRDASVDLEIKQPDTTRKNLILTLQDYSLDTKIAGAEVIITGPFGFYYKGNSDAEGVIRLYDLAAGEYTLLATAAGYQNTDVDILANDRFTL